MPVERTRNSRLILVTFSVPANFRAVAAITHVTPTAAVILAAIDEEPPAIIALALMDFRNQIRSDQKFGG